MRCQLQSESELRSTVCYHNFSDALYIVDALEQIKRIGSSTTQGVIKVRYNIYT